MSPLFLFVALALGIGIGSTEALRCWTCIETQYHDHEGAPTVSHGLCGSGPYLNFTEGSEDCPPNQAYCYSRAAIRHADPAREWPADIIQKHCKTGYWGGQTRELGCDTITDHNLVFEHCLCDTDDCNKNIHEFEKTQ